MDRFLKIITLAMAIAIVGSVPYDFLQHRFVSCDTDTDCLETFGHEAHESQYRLVRAWDDAVHRWKIHTDPEYAYYDRWASELWEAEKERLSSVKELDVSVNNIKPNQE